MEKIKNETLKKALLTIYEWGKQNNADYVDVSFYDDLDFICLTYTIKGTKKYRDDGKIEDNYYKTILFKKGSLSLESEKEERASQRLES